MKKIKKLIALLAAVVLLAGFCSCAHAASYQAKVFSASMQVFASPSTSARSLGALGQGKAFTVRAISGDWALVEYRGRTGYAKMSDIMFSNKVSGVVTRDSKLSYITRASYREGTYFKANIQAGAQVYVIGIHGNYLLVTNGGGSVLGYIKAANVRRV